MLRLSIVLLFGLLLNACASGPHEESTGQFFDSTALTMKVKTRLLESNQVNGLAITVNTYKNNVQLSGFVKNEQEKLKAAEIVHSVPGVGDVTNSLEIKNNRCVP